MNEKNESPKKAESVYAQVVRERLRIVRSVAGISLEELADISGSSKSRLGHIFSGKSSLLISSVEVCCEGCGFDAYALLGGEETFLRHLSRRTRQRLASIRIGLKGAGPSCANIES